MKQISTTNYSPVTGGGQNSICRSVALLFGVLVLMASCQKSHVKKTVPLHAEFQTTAVIFQEGPPELDSIYGWGHGTPIGKSSFIALPQFDADGNLTGTITTIAQNGDKLFSTIAGHSPDVDKEGNITLHFQSVIVGGTGVFSGATGSFSGLALGNIYTPAGTSTWDGTITFK